jgi:hypothetical protein
MRQLSNIANLCTGTARLVTDSKSAPNDEGITRQRADAFR